ncbi:MAG: UvrD-helicase domain-containing protein [Porphyromonas sp.]|nr:UvrD-helicase domain-containing protein [Porphyromonas sp.]
MSQLHVYKASAGSGKTHTLVREYLKLLLNANPQSGYREVLVATFTNKATTELRERIIELLLKLKNGEDVGEDMQKALDPIDRDKVSETLEAILHDYSSLRVQTIDSFFQEVVRSFAFELSGEGASADVELDKETAIEMSVDQVMMQLDSENLKMLSAILVDREEEGDRSDIRAEIINLAKQLLYSPDALEHDVLNLKREDIKAAKQELIDKRKAALSAMEDPLKELKERLGQADIVDILDQSFHSFLVTLSRFDLLPFIKNKVKDPDQTVYRKDLKIDQPNFIVGKTKAKRGGEAVQRFSAVEDELRRLLIKFETAVNGNYLDYHLADLLLENISLLPLLGDLKKEIDNYQRQHNIILIEEINQLISTIINDSSTPFIYEKVGSRINHYMIDEFQDTNGIQWNNMKVLIEEGLSKGYDSYLVGDVKQSIYRFRGTDSSLLNSKVMNDSDLSGYINRQSLQKNWRSNEKIVVFNNEVFNDVYNFEAHANAEGQGSNLTNKAIYAEDDVKQEPMKGKGKGYVRFEKVSKEEDEFRTRMQDLLLSIQKDGYSPGDIAFIVRTNNDAKKIAELLNQLAINDPDNRDKYTYLSDEALMVEYAQVVKLITTLYQYAANRADPQKNLLLDIALLPFPGVEKEQLKKAIDSGGSLYEVTARLFDWIGVPESEELYANAFLDLIYEFSEKEANTYLQFENWWEKVGSKKMVTMGSGQNDKIQIITLHKSKGLEFEVVILPYVNWEISKIRGNSRNLDFCDSKDLPHNFVSHPLDFYLIPSAPTQEKLNSHLQKKYYKIHEANYLDNLNLLYVAMTRPKHRLYMFTNEEENTKMVTRILYDRIPKVKGIEGDGASYWEYGTESEKVTQPPQRTYNAVQLRLNNNKADQPLFTTIQTDPPFDSEATKHGKIMHDVMSRAITKEDFRQAIGRLKVPKAEEEAFFNRLDEATANPRVMDWFTPKEGRQILVEQEIHLGQGSRKERPDRIIIDGNTACVVDFKFGDRIETSPHQKQVKRYMDTLKKLGYEVSGYLWYWEKNEIEEVR